MVSDNGICLSTVKNKACIILCWTTLGISWGQFYPNLSWLMLCDYIISCYRAKTCIFLVDLGVRGVLVQDSFHHCNLQLLYFRSKVSYLVPHFQKVVQTYIEPLFPLFSTPTIVSLVFCLQWKGFWSSHTLLSQYSYCEIIYYLRNANNSRLRASILLNAITLLIPQWTSSNDKTWIGPQSATRLNVFGVVHLLILLSSSGWPSTRWHFKYPDGICSVLTSRKTYCIVYLHL